MDSQESHSSSSVLRELLANPSSGEAWRKFTAKYQPRIKTSCRHLGLQEADSEEVTAIILLKFYERDVFKKFVYQGKEKFAGWLGKVVRHAVFTFLRDRKHEPDAWCLGDSGAQHSLEQVAEEVVRNLGVLCEDDLALGKEALACVAQRVDEKTMQAFHMQVIEERKGEEVARQLDMSLAAVYKARSRVAQMLKVEFTRLQRA